MAGAQRQGRLNARLVETIAEPGRYSDGRGAHGLSLLVRETSDGRLAKTWSQRITLGGRQTNLGLGPYPVVTLAEARDKALDNRRTVHGGGDPRRGDEPTFRDAAEAVIEFRRRGWSDSGRSEKQWRGSLERHVFPKIGDKRVGEITTADVLDVLLPIWHEKSETARRVRLRIRAVMDWAIANSHRSDNPAGEALSPVLPKQAAQTTHYPALPHEEVKGALEKIQNSVAQAPTRLAFRFMVLTASRPGEALGATWSEIDLQAREWAIPAERMKMAAQHRVPLSKQALAVLDEARCLPAGPGLVFPSATGRELSDATMSKLARMLELGAVPHGFRSSFRDWCADTGVAREVAEACLAHAVAGVEGAYKRTDFFDRRRPVMEDWAAYVT
ncbi:tyrosine-type recombinase/integrase [Candidatus Poriferisocius sp.]|uniref:tyrosine-type recombinase/integrase n=1 Tax=Candidatus Poriferisocius sp. TaxID=3101276 RepID=UPI003B0163E4